ncbi:MAG: TonB-dependent receptor plug domain-containing protein [Proteobacteria bacterium]|nr:TonB-dependent receptor plug domain-containing protein [Pseudomonadota bacterium]
MAVATLAVAPVRALAQENAQAPGEREALSEGPVEGEAPIEGEGEVIEMTGEAPSMATVLERSAAAVDVVETEEAQRESADMGEVLARSEGVGVRRGGGLGSDERISLAGLSGEQVRFFVDGVPIELTGFALGIGNVPVNLIERVEIYRGVVPVRFGADALGGAFNLVTDEDRHGTKGSASYQVGSFGMHRATLGGRYKDDATGLFVRANGFADYTRNDYAIDVEVPNERGRLEPANVDRFHDGYRAAGGGVEFGIVDKPWAERLQLQSFYTDYNKDLQHNAVMTVPYGEVTHGEMGAGGTARYVQDLAPRVRLDAVAGYAYRRIEFRDVGEWVYDWRGERIRERAQAGEIESRPHDQVYWQHGAFARIGLAWSVAAQHRLRFAVSPSRVLSPRFAFPIVGVHGVGSAQTRRKPRGSPHLRHSVVRLRDCRIRGEELAGFSPH